MLHYEQQLLSQRAPEQALHLRHAELGKYEEGEQRRTLVSTMKGVRASIGTLLGKTKEILTKEHTIPGTQKAEELLTGLFTKTPETAIEGTSGEILSHIAFHKKSILQELLEEMNMQETDGVEMLSAKRLQHMRAFLKTNGTMLRDDTLQSLQDLYAEDPAMQEVIGELYAEKYLNNPAAGPSTYLEEIVAKLEPFLGKPVGEILAYERQELRRDKLRGGIFPYVGNKHITERIVREYQFDYETDRFVLSPKGEKLFAKNLIAEDGVEKEAILEALANAGRRTVPPFTLREKILLVNSYEVPEKKTSLWEKVKGTFAKSRKEEMDPVAEAKEKIYSTLNEAVYTTAGHILAYMKPEARKEIARLIESTLADMRNSAFKKGVNLDRETLYGIDAFYSFVKSMSIPGDDNLARAYGEREDVALPV